MAFSYWPAFLHSQLVMVKFDSRHLLEGVGLLYKPWQIVVLCQARVCVSTWAQSYDWGATWARDVIKPGACVLSNCQFCYSNSLKRESLVGLKSLKYSDKHRLSSVFILLPHLPAFISIITITRGGLLKSCFLSLNYLHLKAAVIQRKHINDKKIKPLSPQTKWSSRKRSWRGEIDRLATIFT